MPDQTSIPQPVAAALAAANANDTEAFLDCFAGDGVVDDWGREFGGREAIRRGVAGDKVARMTIRE